MGLASVVLALCVPLIVPGLHPSKLFSSGPGIGGSGGSRAAVALPDTLSQTLRDQRHKVEETSALLSKVIAATDIAIFHEGKIRHLGTLAFGGNNVTSDIVHGLGVTQAEAERLKERYGCAYEPLVDPEEVMRARAEMEQ